MRSNHPVGAVVNFVGTSQPEPLNFSAIFPNHVPLGSLIGSYAASYGTPTASVQSQWKNDAPPITHQVITVTHDTDINRESVVTLLKQLAARFTDRPIPLVFDNARYQRNA